MSPGISTHSIIAVKNPDDPRRDWTESVINYSSAHVDGADSELVVHSGHSTQDHPQTIEKVRRILLDISPPFSKQDSAHNKPILS